MEQSSGWAAIETGIVNFFGAHPGVLMTLLALLALAACVVLFALVYAPMRVAYLKLQYPDKATRPNDVRAQMASLNVFMKLAMWAWSFIPIAGKTPPPLVDNDSIDMPKPDGKP